MKQNNFQENIKNKNPQNRIKLINNRTNTNNKKHRVIKNPGDQLITL